MLLLYDVQHVGAGDTVELHHMFTDSTILSGVHVFVTQFNKHATVSTPGYIVLFEVAYQRRFPHCISASHLHPVQRFILDLERGFMSCRTGVGSVRLHMYDRTPQHRRRITLTSCIIREREILLVFTVGCLIVLHEAPGEVVVLNELSYPIPGVHPQMRRWERLSQSMDVTHQINMAVWENMLHVMNDLDLISVGSSVRPAMVC